MSCGATLATQMDSQRLLLGIGAPFDGPREHLAAQAAHSEVIRKITFATSQESRQPTGRIMRTATTNSVRSWACTEYSMSLR